MPFFILLTLLLNLTAFAQRGNFNDSRDKVSVTVNIDPQQAPPGQDVVLAIVLDHEAHWHTHTQDPQIPDELDSEEDYIATSLHFDLPDDSPLTIHTGFIQWPPPTIVEVGFGTSLVDYGVFEKETIIYVPITIARDAPLGPATFKVNVVFQACDDKQCLRPTPRPDSGDRWDNYGITSVIDIVDVETLANFWPHS